MSYTFKEYSRVISPRTQDRVRKLTEPLREHFSCPYFSYQKVGSNGEYQNLGDRPDWLECYSENEFFRQSSIIHHPKFFTSGEYLLSSIDPAAPLVDGLTSHGIGNTLLIMRKNKEGLEVFGFSVPTQNELLINVLIREISSLHAFCSYFKSETAGILDADEAVDVSSTCPQQLLKLPQTFPSLSSVDRLRFLSKMDSTLPYLRANSLSRRERQCLALLRDGLTMSGMGDELELSARTVEHYLEGCKDKLLCNSRQELVQFANLLARVGFFEEVCSAGGL